MIEDRALIHPSALLRSEPFVRSIKRKFERGRRKANEAGEGGTKPVTGIVLVSGFVHSPQVVSRAVEVARGVSGVKAVTNTLLVK